MRHKTKPCAAQASFGHGFKAVGLNCYFDTFFLCPLAHYPEIVGCTCGFQLQGDLFPLVVEPVQDPLVLLGRYFIFFYFLAPACRNQHEDVQGFGIQFYCKVEDVWYLFYVPLCYGCVYLEAYTCVLYVLNTGKSCIE